MRKFRVFFTFLSQKAELTKKSEQREKDLARLEEAFIELNESRERLESEKNSAEDLNDTYLRKISELEELLDQSENKIQVLCKLFKCLLLV